MTHGRIETTPEQQLAELRQAYARYATLADRLHDDDAVDAKVREARERNARRIALAYEKTIASTAMRMESMHRTHADGRGFTRRAKGLSVMLAGAVIVCGALVVYVRPDIRGTLAALVPARAVPEQIASTAPPASAISGPAAMMSAPVESVPLVSAPVVPAPRPAQAEDQAAVKPVAKPAIALPNERVEKIAPQRDQKNAAPQASAPARTPPVTAPTVTAPVRQASAVPSPMKPAALPAVTPLTTPSAPQVPTPQATVEPLSPPRNVAALPSPQALTAESPQAAAKAIETPAAPVSAQTQAPTKLVPVAGTHLRPPYPLDAKRAGEEGTTQMEVSISTLGTIADCKVIGTSGSARLDATACSFVQRNWRWQPPTRDGREVSTTTKIAVVWNLINGR